MCRWVVALAIGMVGLVGCDGTRIDLEPDDDAAGDDDVIADDDDVSADDDDVVADDDDVIADDDDTTGDDDTTTGSDGDGDGWSVEAGDCDDADPTVSPASAETCNGVDDDCDGVVDEDCVECAVLVPSDVATIGDAISGAVDGDVICVEPGQYLETIDLAGKGVHLLGLGGAEITELDASYSDTTVTLDSGEGADTVVENLTILRGNATGSGGGIRIEDSSPTLRGLVVDACRADLDGGGIYLHNSFATMTDVVVRDSFAVVDGGGVYVSSSEVELLRVMIEGNEALENGGGLVVDQSEVAFDDGTIADNFAGWAGGGARVEGWSELDISGSWIEDNAAGVWGGGLDLDGPNVLQMTDSSVEGNRSDFGFAGDGGGIRLTNGSAGYITGSTFTHNVAGSYGGGLYVDGGLVHLEDCEFAGNVTDSGGGLFGSESTLELNGVVFRENIATSNGTASDGGAMRLSFYSQASIDGCVFEDNSADGDGGAIATRGEIIGYHNLIAGNTAGQYGGGVFVEDTSLWLNNLVVLGNSATTGGGFYVEEESELTLRYAAVVANIADEGGGIYSDTYADLTLTLSLVNVTDNEAALAGGGVVCEAACVSTLTESNLWNNSPEDLVGLTATPDNHYLDPQYLDATSPDPTEWDLHLSAASPLVDLAPNVWTDPDGSPGDIGAYSGGDADEWDLDGDGWPLWWQPGEYDHGVYPGLGWDCDDRDDTIYPGNGC